eukprot:CAMPEP_0184994616 /NCGR_PEP_ID=MMETSP1098-20130426/49910_1 /TAXON_ID=89044 /ORGANISM="Spumella elongata, Strain CCAP 955/1" /LENGTH=312 /DNA_ID=CAMNT_0027520715 /DNA_START=31 /DNA_END=969 /DNA_ORIENTATION=+
MNGSEGGTPKKISAGPKTRVCYVCGRQYGLHSFEIHLKQCKELWIAREAEKDPRERKKLPEDPMLKFASGSGGGGGGDGYDGDSGVPSGSGRGGGGGGGGGNGMPTAKELEEINRASTAAFNTEALDTCAFCGRTFLPEKLKIHNRSCTADKPARSLTDGVRRGNASGYTPSAAPTPTKEESNSTPVRPGSSAGIPKSRPVSKTPSEYSNQNETPNLRVSDGNLVGHLGGSAGRPLRNSKSPSAGASEGGITTTNNNGGAGAGKRLFNAADFEDKDDLIDFLINKLVVLEATAAELSQSISDIRSVVDALRS